MSSFVQFKKDEQVNRVRQRKHNFPSECVKEKVTVIQKKRC